MDAAWSGVRFRPRPPVVPPTPPCAECRPQRQARADAWHTALQQLEGYIRTQMTAKAPLDRTDLLAAIADTDAQAFVRAHLAEMLPPAAFKAACMDYEAAMHELGAPAWEALPREHQPARLQQLFRTNTVELARAMAEGRPPDLLTLTREGVITKRVTTQVLEDKQFWTLDAAAGLSPAHITALDGMDRAAAAYLDTRHRCYECGCSFTERNNRGTWLCPGPDRDYRALPGYDHRVGAALPDAIEAADLDRLADYVQDSTSTAEQPGVVVDTSGKVTRIRRCGP